MITRAQNRRLARALADEIALTLEPATRDLLLATAACRRRRVGLAAERGWEEAVWRALEVAELAADDERGVDGEDDMADGRIVGPCCACGKTRDLRTFVMLDGKAPTPGRGWGCVVCGLATDGAIAALCDECACAAREPQLACAGYPGEPGRVPVAQLVGEHVHDEARHLAEEQGVVSRLVDAVQRVRSLRDAGPGLGPERYTVLIVLRAVRGLLMVRASAPTGDGGVMLLLGLTPANLRRVRAGEPIYVDGEPLGAPGVKVLICFGETERHIVADLRAGGIEVPAGVEESVRAVEAEHRRKGTTP